MQSRSRQALLELRRQGGGGSDGKARGARAPAQTAAGGGGVMAEGKTRQAQLASQLDASPISPLYLPYISPISPLHSSPARCTNTTRRAPGAGGGKSAGHLASLLTSFGVSLGG